MQDKNTSKQHQEIAHIIKSAKKKLFKDHSEGRDWRKALEEFSEVTGVKITHVLCPDSLAEITASVRSETEIPTEKRTLSEPDEAEIERETAQFHEQRYGEGRKKIPGEYLEDKHLEEIVERICGKNYDSEAANALIVLMDEIERASFDHLDIGNIVISVTRTAFKYSITFNEATDALIKQQRSELAQLAGGAQ